MELLEMSLKQFLEAKARPKHVLVQLHPPSPASTGPTIPPGEVDPSMQGNAQKRQLLGIEQSWL